ncbi:acyl carrier protein [Streptomyces sp. NPDC002680]|uniref:acyl carrier protein n=1 Tax=Streptomyces sp. NPDC002680 TaxID=3364659 RepID=UPI00368A6A73
MAEMTLESLKDMLHRAAGESDEAPDVTNDLLDTEFTDLGYDSLAVLEVSGMIEREYRISLDDDHASSANTPRLFLELVNGMLDKAEAA